LERRVVGIEEGLHDVSNVERREVHCVRVVLVAGILSGGITKNFYGRATGVIALKGEASLVDGLIAVSLGVFMMIGGRVRREIVAITPSSPTTMRGRDRR
jgi:hypothetical protein